MSNNISLQKNKTGKRKLQSTSSKKRSERKKKPKKDKEKEKMPQDESTVTAPGLRTPLPPSIWKETKCDARVGERDGLGWGGRNDSGLDGWWWMKQWHFSSGASVCECVWYTLAVCVCVRGGGGLMPRSWILQGPSLQQHLTFDLPAVLGSTHLQWPLEIKNINILMLTKECVCV